MSPEARGLGKILASAFLFSCLGLGGLLLSLLACPILWLLPASRRRTCGTALIHHCFRGFVWGLEVSGILRVHAVDLPDAGSTRGAVLVANHPSWLDIVVLLALLPGAVCVVKQAVWFNPFFGLLVRTAGFLPIRDAERLLEDGAAALARGQALVLFPEGTRTRPDQPLAFQRGAAHLALRTGAPLIPLVLTVTPPLLEKGDRWYDVPIHTCLFRVRGRQPFSFDPPPPEGPERVQRARQVTEVLEGFYDRELHGTQHHPA